MLGETISFSLYATMVTFVGGPYDGEVGMFHHPYYNDSYSICDSQRKVTHEYRPRAKNMQNRHYDFYGTWDWTTSGWLFNKAKPIDYSLTG